MKNIPAFPLHPACMKGQEGMTLRDYFASMAITSIMATPWFQHTSSQRGSAEYAEELSSECYSIADAMLEARDK